MAHSLVSYKMEVLVLVAYKKCQGQGTSQVFNAETGFPKNSTDAGTSGIDAAFTLDLYL